MKVIKPGRSLVVPTERTACLHCGAELEYAASDVELIRIRVSPGVQPGELPGPVMEVMAPPHRIRCGSCGGLIEIRDVPGPPHF